LRIKKAMRKAQNAAGGRPGQALQRRAWPFWPQPEGNGVKTAPTEARDDGQTGCLAKECNDEWRCFHPVRTWDKSCEQALVDGRGPGMVRHCLVDNRRILFRAAHPP
jgi:hypothetical protein